MGPLNAHAGRPALPAPAGDPGGARVLGVGCEAGRLAEEFAARGARVLRLAGHATLVDHARARLAGRGELPVDERHRIDADTHRRLSQCPTSSCRARSAP
ncbi:hypothetical protein [Streptomyces profundus]|uniref:hypothetical protein n=1 Tax=Streptomyces profundus TaxID=2867410 RepID=UPI001D163E2B|nr:hypothetical protein [Streptomyces sp. MA3_2.13]UED88118.1 hypothetical protein K4G22_31190 [Streptomyces sp. MA3_2.13]